MNETVSAVGLRMPPLVLKTQQFAILLLQLQASFLRRRQFGLGALKSIAPRHRPLFYRRIAAGLGLTDAGELHITWSVVFGAVYRPVVFHQVRTA